MADAPLPKLVIIQSFHSHAYLQFDKENSTVPGALQFTKDQYSFDHNTRFEVVKSTIHPGLIHIRSLHNNKYWAANYGADNKLVTAMAIKPEEIMGERNCTLFRPEFPATDDKRNIHLVHCSTGSYISTCGGADRGEGLMCLRSRSDADLLTIINWKDVVMLPNIIRIKGDNGKYLKAFEGGYMDYNYEADNSAVFDYEVYPSRDGGIRLKSVAYDTYWTDMGGSGWVLLKKGSSTHETSTVFIPTLVKGNSIYLRCLHTGKYCKRYSTDEKTNCLAGHLKYPEDSSCMEIDEPVISRKIDNVTYRTDDAKKYDEKTVALIIDDTSNRTDQNLTSQLNIKTSVTNTTKWSTSSSWKVGAEVTVSIGIPFIESGQFSISGSYERSSDWGETETKTFEVGKVETFTLAPMTRVKGSLMATRLSYDIPFTYTQHDILKDGSSKVTEKKDGIFTGHGGYGYKCVISPLPLE